MLPVDFEDGLLPCGEPDPSDDCFPGNPRLIAAEHDPGRVLEIRTDLMSDFLDLLFDYSVISSHIKRRRQLEGEVVDPEQKMVGAGGFVDHVEMRGDIHPKGRDIPELFGDTVIRGWFVEYAGNLFPLGVRELGGILVTPVAGK